MWFSCASCRDVTARWTPTKKSFSSSLLEAFKHWRLFPVFEWQINWVTRKHRGNNTMITQYMTVVRLPYHQPTVYSRPPCFSIIWHQLCILCLSDIFNTRSQILDNDASRLLFWSSVVSFFRKKLRPTPVLKPGLNYDLNYAHIKFCDCLKMNVGRQLRNLHNVRTLTYLRCRS